MTNRVILGALPGGGYGLRVSRPGYDVTNAGLAPSALSFDSSWLKTARVHTQGSVYVPAEPSGLAWTSTYFTAVSPLPAVMALREEGGKFYPIQLGSDVSKSGWYPSSPGIYGEGMRIFSNRLDFSRFNGRNYTAHYIVMRPL